MQAAASFSGNFAEMIANTLRAGLTPGDNPMRFRSKERGDRDQGSHVPLGPTTVLGRLEGEMPGNTGPAAGTVRRRAGQAAAAADLGSLPASPCCLPRYSSDLSS